MIRIFLLSLFLFSCSKLDDIEICGQKGDIAEGFVGSELACSTPDGLQDKCIADAVKVMANTGTVIGDYRFFDNEKDKQNRLIRFKDEADKCLVKYPCGVGSNGPCFQ